MKKFSRLCNTSIVLLSLILMVFPVPVSGIRESEFPIHSPVSQEEVPVMGWPMPDKPIPHHDVGHVTPALDYTTEVEIVNPETRMLETIELSGVDALAADGMDPFAGNYSLLSLDKVLRSSSIPGTGPYYNFNMETFAIGTDPGSIAGIPDTYYDYGKFPRNDVAAGDLNNDGQAEQILAWLDDDDFSLNLYTTEMPGYIGKTTSQPALVTTAWSIHLLVRGYDHTLWHLDDVDSPTLTWDKNGGGGLLLSAPTVIATGSNAFDVYAILANNLIYRRSWSEGVWSVTGWELVDDPAYWQPLEQLVPVPELAAPAVVVREGQIDVFRLASDNTLHWRHFNGSTWEVWQNLGGMLASGPCAISMAASHIQVFALGADNVLWTRTYNSGWESWQRLDLGGMPTDVHIASSPVIVAVPAGQNIVYARGSDDHLWKMTYFDDAYNDWIDQGGTLASAPGVALMEGHLPYVVAQNESGGLEISRVSSPWEYLADGLPAIPTNLDTGFVGESRNFNELRDLSVDVETGYFWGDGRSQTVAAYASAANQVTVALFDTSLDPDHVGFTQNFITSIAINDASYFRIAVGDFLYRDGVDDIAVFRISSDVHYFAVDILAFNRDAVTPQFEYGVPSISFPGYPDASFDFSGTLSVAPGDFDADGADELALSISFAKYHGDWVGSCSGNRFHLVTRVFDVVLVAGSTDTYEIKHYIPSIDGKDKGNWDDTANLDASTISVALTIAAGDVDGDGQDEIVRTWPNTFGTEWEGCSFSQLEQSDKFQRKVEILNLEKNIHWTVNTWDADNTNHFIDVVIAVPDSNLSGQDSASYRDFLVVGDFDQDLVEEILYYKGYSSTGQYFNVFEYNPGTGLYIRRLDQFENGVRYYPRFAAGDYTGEGLRVGTPSFRIQDRMTTPVVFLNKPPVHRDIIEIEGFPTLIEIGTGAYSQYIFDSATSDKSKVEANRDWSLSASLESSIGGPAGTITASLGNTYGESFSKATEEITARTLTITTTADSDDQVLFDRSKYGVWEYPVLGAGASIDNPYISVVFPLNTTQTKTPEKMYGGECSARSYVPNHQVNNIWSYDDELWGTLESADRDPDRAYLLDDTSQGDVDINLTLSSQGITDVSSSFSNTISAGLSYSYENELSLPIIGKAYDFSFRSSLDTSYTMGGLSTYSSEVSTGSTVVVRIPFPGGSGNTYDTRSILYWAKAGYLVLDFQTEPKGGGYWTYYDKPDPAFTLPWYGLPDPDTGIFPSLGQDDAPPCGLDKQLFTHDIQLDPGYVQYGETLTMSATVRNFSYETSSPVRVDFFLGIPAGDNAIGHCTTLTPLDRGNGAEQCSTTWIVDRGSGEEKIYAVIDYAGSLVEMHDENTMVNNNVGYGLVNIANADYLDPGLQLIQPYYDIQYEQAPGLGYGLYLPTNNTNESIRFELVSTAISGAGVVGTPIEIAAFRGGLELLGYDIGATPAALMAIYRDADLGGADEGNLQLYRFDDPEWVPAVCLGYEQIHFTTDNMLAVPICQTGIYLLSTTYPGTVVVNEPPSFTSVPDISAEVDAAYVYNIAASDPEGGVLTIGGTFPAWLSLVDNGDGSASLSGTPSTSNMGSHPIQLTVTDIGGLYDTQSFSITVSGEQGDGIKIYLPLILK